MLPDNALRDGRVNILQSLFQRTAFGGRRDVCCPALDVCTTSNRLEKKATKLGPRMIRVEDPNKSQRSGLTRLRPPDRRSIALL